MESRIRILHWLRLLLLPAGMAGWSRKARQGIRLRRDKLKAQSVPTEQQKLNTLKEINITPMESGLRILRWLSLLLLSAGFAGWSRRARQDTWFRRTEMPPGFIRGKTLLNNRIRKLKNIPMESGLRILRWLSLLLLSAGLVGWSRRAGKNTRIRQLKTRVGEIILFKWKETKRKIKIYKRTMKLQLQMMRWLSLLLLSEGLQREPASLSHLAWFRRP